MPRNVLRKNVLQRRVEEDPQENDGADEGDEAGNSREEVHPDHRKRDDQHHSNDRCPDCPYTRTAVVFHLIILFLVQ